jgi:hypothetical protein
VQQPNNDEDADSAQLIAAAVGNALGSEAAATPASVAATRALADTCVAADVGGQRVALVVRADHSPTSSTFAAGHALLHGLISTTVGGRALQQFVLKKGGYRVVQVQAADLEAALAITQKGEHDALTHVVKELLRQHS